MHDSYKGFMPRMLTLQNLMDTPGRTEVASMIKSGVASADRPMSTLILYTDLQNPLLKKYKFDPKSFLVGSKEAFLQVHQAIASADFFNFSNGFSTTSDANTILKSSLHPKLYSACSLACKDLHGKNIQTFMTSAIVNSISMERVTTDIQQGNIEEKSNSDRVVEGGVKENDIGSDSSVKSVTEGAESSVRDVKQEEEDKEINILNAANGTSDTPPSDTPPSASSSSDATVNVDGEDVVLSTKTYPPGSVVAQVDVVIEAEEVYETKVEDGSTMPTMRKTVMMWTFKGCISGQEELDWQIVAFDGYGEV